MTEENGRQASGGAERQSGPGVNKVMLLGRLTADPNMRFAPNGEPVTRLRLATNIGPRTDFHSLVTFGPTARFAGEYLSKGRLVFAEGHLQTSEWSDQDGVKRHTTEVITENLQALGPRPQRDDAQREEREAER
jgi:single-strand DNA-binding protein